jgi:hypothetical protein
LEEFDAEEIGQGLICERYNMRGLFSRGLREGGARERVLASEARAWAAAVSEEWPRTAMVLEDLAGMWDKEAEWVDRRRDQDDLA